MGFLVAIILVFLVAAIDTSPPHYGRYQLSAWAGRFGKDGGGVGVFVIDTTTGETKTAYSRIFGKDNGRVIVNNLRKPFTSMK